MKKGTAKAKWLNDKGYVRMWDYEEDKVVFEHRRVWRKHYGPVPPGYFIHHIDGNKENNDISNLMLVDVLTHKRLQSGCELRDGEWWKPCRKCGVFKKVNSEYYRHYSGITSVCKACHVADGIERRRKKGER